MMHQPIAQKRNRRVRAILLTPQGTLLFIKRVKTNKAPYYVAPGGGVEKEDADLLATLERELCEELGAEAEVLAPAFVLRHEKAGKRLEEYFFICRLHDYDLSKRHGPEFEDPSRGQYIPVEVPLDAEAIGALNIKTPELQTWLIANLEALKNI
ncbi:MAG: NUDIX domain-containing protein [Chloroflexi bacterium]|nr:MAG: NUDIX domain-containing protein [Chloroflexota bacterium]